MEEMSEGLAWKGLSLTLAPPLTFFAFLMPQSEHLVPHPLPKHCLTGPEITEPTNHDLKPRELRAKQAPPFIPVLMTYATHPGYPISTRTSGSCEVTESLLSLYCLTHL